MAGINVPQYDIFKLGTKKLKYNKWDITISEQEARQHNEIVALFEGQEFRIIANILDRSPPEIDYKKYILSVLVENPKHFDRVVSNTGIIVNGITFIRFLGTTGGLKCNTILLVNVEILDELNKRIECERDPSIPIVPAKLEAYKALSCSASQPICSPRGILVVKDALIHIKHQHVEFLDNTDDSLPTPIWKTLTDYETNNTTTDGYNLCTIGYMERVAESLGIRYIPHGVCLRNAWLKGMLFPFPILEFVDEYITDNISDEKYIVRDIWGNKHDLREIEMILTESSLKLWSSYSSIDDYLEKCARNSFNFSVTKIFSPILDNQRELNYQYLQSYDFTDEDIKELCEPTVTYLKNALCGDYKSVKDFLGIMNNIRSENNQGWQQALQIDERMMEDPFIIDSVYKMIHKKIDRAKIGKLIVNGNYQVCSGDPVLFMQELLGLEKNGLLKEGECYSKYWIDKGVDEIVVYRSPMLVHNNIRKMTVKSDPEMKRWYKYMGTVFIVNGYDTTCQALSGMDFDSDIAFTTNNRVLIDKHVDLPAIVCAQRNAEKKVPTEQDMIQVERNGMGNKVGSITNRITAMLERIASFDKDSKEYKELYYRCLCGQTYQQDEIDKLKGTISTPMPSSWYNYRGCNGDPYLKSICAEKKPYFMIYIYNDYKKKFNNYKKQANNSALVEVKKTIDEILETDSDKLTDKEKQLLFDYEKWNPFGMNPCTMNRICWHIEKEFKGYTRKIKKDSHFNYKDYQYGVNIDEDTLDAFIDFAEQYQEELRRIKNYRLSTNVDNTDAYMQLSVQKTKLQRRIKTNCYRICPDPKERLDGLLQLYGEKKCSGQFFWMCAGDLMVKKLEEIKGMSQLWV